jgi:hypothetical protein
MVKDAWFHTLLSTGSDSLDVHRSGAESFARKQGYVNMIQLLSSASREDDTDIAPRAAPIARYCIGYTKQASQAF